MTNIQTILNDNLADSEVRNLFMNYKDCSSYICDAIAEHADSRIDIYTSDLMDWGRTHTQEIDIAADELGKPDSFIGYIQQGQYHYYSGILWDNLEDGILWAVFEAASEYAEELTQEQIDALEELAASIDSNSRFNEITSGVEEILNTEE
jgi:hypothetical protein